MNADPCESGSTALDGYTKQNSRMHTLLSSNMTQQWSDRDSIYSTKSYLQLRKGVCHILDKQKAGESRQNAEWWQIRKKGLGADIFQTERERDAGRRQLCFRQTEKEYKHHPYFGRAEYSVVCRIGTYKWPSKLMSRKQSYLRRTGFVHTKRYRQFIKQFL